VSKALRTGAGVLRDFPAPVFSRMAKPSGMGSATGIASAKALKRESHA